MNVEAKPKNKIERIIIVGYPKSGNTWLTRLVAQICNSPVAGFLDANHINVNDFVIEGEEKPKNFEILKTHHWSRTLRASEKDKIIYIIRDPRQVLYSALHYFPKVSTQAIAKCGTLERLILSFCKKELAIWYSIMTRGNSQPTNWLLQSWANHVDGFSKDDSVLILRYEDLRANSLHALRRVCTYLEIEISDDQLQKCILDHSFEKKKNKLIQAGEHSKALFMREGKSDSWKTKFPLILRLLIWIRFRKTMKTHGYEF